MGIWCSFGLEKFPLSSPFISRPPLGKSGYYYWLLPQLKKKQKYKLSIGGLWRLVSTIQLSPKWGEAVVAQWLAWWTMGAKVMGSNLPGFHSLTAVFFALRFSSWLLLKHGHLEYFKGCPKALKIKFDVQKDLNEMKKKLVICQWRDLFLHAFHKNSICESNRGIFHFILDFFNENFYIGRPNSTVKT